MILLWDSCLSTTDRRETCAKLKWPDIIKKYCGNSMVSFIQQIFKSNPGGPAFGYDFERDTLAIATLPFKSSDMFSYVFE